MRHYIKHSKGRPELNPTLKSYRWFDETDERSIEGDYQLSFAMDFCIDYWDREWPPRIPSVRIDTVDLSEIQKILDSIEMDRDSVQEFVAGEYVITVDYTDPKFLNVHLVDTVLEAFPSSIYDLKSSDLFSSQKWISKFEFGGEGTGITYCELNRIVQHCVKLEKYKAMN